MSFEDKLNDFAEYAKSKQVPEEIRLKRVDICNGCDKKVSRLGVDVCAQCNCILPLKQRMKGVPCPLGKW